MKINSRFSKIVFTLSLCGFCSALAFLAGRASLGGGALAALSNAKSKPAPTKVVVADLAASIAQRGITLNSLLKSPGLPDAEALALWAASLSAKDCSEDLAKLQSLPTGVQRDALLKAVVAAWAKHDPAGFLAATGQVNNPRLRESGVTDALRDLAATDPQSALAWLKQNPGTGSASVMEARTNAAITGYAMDDPVGAFNYINAMDEATKQDTKLKTDAFDAFAQGMAQNGQYSDAMAMISQLPNGKIRDDAFNSVVGLWGAASPVDAANWIASNAPASSVNDYNETLVGSWVKSDPAAAAVYAVQAEQQLADQGALGGADNTDTLPNTISTWAKYDLDATAQFINQMPASAVKDRALASFIGTADKVDPATAISWVGAITDPALGNKLMQQVATQWQQADPAGYNQFLATTTILTTAQIQMLASMPPPSTGKKGGAAGNSQGNNQN